MSPSLLQRLSGSPSSPGRLDDPEDSPGSGPWCEDGARRAPVRVSSSRDDVIATIEDACGDDLTCTCVHRIADAVLQLYR